MAHIGVIEVLEKQGFRIAEVVGCSMGAVVGGLYASGHLPQYREWLCSLHKADILGLLDFTLTKRGFLKGEKVFSTILRMTGEQMIEDLDIPFAVVATDMYTGEEVVFREGDLFEALRATVSIPGVFTPAKVNGRVLIDGGVINPLPLNLIEAKENHLIIAVDINAPSAPKQVQEMVQTSKNWLSIPWPWSKQEPEEGALTKASPEDSSPSEAAHKPRPSEIARQEINLVDALQTSYDHMQNRLISLTTEFYPPDALLKIPRSTCGIFEFFRAKEVIELGRQKMEQQLRSNAIFQEYR